MCYKYILLMNMYMEMCWMNIYMYREVMEYYGEWMYVCIMFWMNVNIYV